MHVADLTDLIRRRAYEIWEIEGRPHGRHVIHWLRAESEIREASQEPRVPAKRTGKASRKSAALSRSKSKSSRKHPTKT